MAGDPFTAAIFRWLDVVAADATLPPAAFKLAYAISQHINRQSREAWPSQKTLKESLGLKDERSVRRLTDALEARGFLITLRRKQMSMIYRLAQDRTELSYQEEQTQTGTDARADIPVRSTDQDRTFESARPDNSVPQDRTELSAKPLKEPLIEPGERGRARERRIPDDWKLSDEDHDFALSEGVQDIDGMAAAFADYYRGEGIAKSNWSAMWRRWVRREPQFSGGKGTVSAAARSLARINHAPSPEELSDEAWEQIIARFASTGQWTRHVGLCGGEPPSPTCRAPRHLLVKYGLAEAAA